MSDHNLPSDTPPHDDANANARMALCELLDRIGGDGTTAWLNNDGVRSLQDEIYAAHIHVFNERDDARAWVRRLTADARVLTCAYCGTAYPPSAPASNATALDDHVRACAKHPMRQAEAEAKRLRDIAANAIDHINDGDLRAELRAQLAATAASDVGSEGTETGR